MSSNKIENAQTKALVGMAAVGDWVKNGPSILVGDYDTEISCMCYHTQFEKMPETEDDIKQECIVKHLENIKTHLRIKIANVFQQAEAQAEREEQERDVQGFRNSQQQAPEGTVSELAERFGLSKKKIRQMKRDGTLHTLFENAE